jgi:hypothetical protein
VISNFSDVFSNAMAFDANITNMASSIMPGGEYSDLVSLAIRQVLSSTELTIAKGADGTFNTSDVMLFMRDVDESLK